MRLLSENLFQMKSSNENVGDARSRLFDDLGKGAQSINRIMSSLPKGTEERRLLKLVIDSVFFVSVRQLDDFRGFLAEMEKADAASDKREQK